MDISSTTTTSCGNGFVASCTKRLRESGVASADEADTAEARERVAADEVRVAEFAVRVAGFDDLDESAYSLPSLTTLDPGKRAAAELAVELLERRIRGEVGEDRQVVSPAARLVVRDSTA